MKQTKREWEFGPSWPPQLVMNIVLSSTDFDNQKREYSYAYVHASFINSCNILWAPPLFWTDSFLTVCRLLFVFVVFSLSKSISRFLSMFFFLTHTRLASVVISRQWKREGHRDYKLRVRSLDNIQSKNKPKPQLPYKLPRRSYCSLLKIIITNKHFYFLANLKYFLDSIALDSQQFTIFNLVYSLINCGNLWGWQRWSISSPCVLCLALPCLPLSV